SLAGAAEFDLKGAQNYGGASYTAMGSDDATRLHPHFGFLIASCERADLRPTPRGVMIYGDDAPRLDAVPPPRVPRDEVVREFYDAVVHGRAPVHDGAWGLATMEVCFAMLQSAREGRDIPLRHQTALRIPA